MIRTFFEIKVSRCAASYFLVKEMRQNGSKVERDLIESQFGRIAHTSLAVTCTFERMGSGGGELAD